MNEESIFRASIKMGSNPIQFVRWHLFFADDLFLFGRANVSQAKVIRSVLDRFCFSSASGAL